MKIRNCPGFGCLLIIVVCAFGMAELRVSNKWQATVKVLDEDGNPVRGARVNIGYYIPPSDGESIGTAKVSGLSDASGICTGSHEDGSSDLLIGVHKEGYYKTALTYELGLPYAYQKAKWNPELTLVLKKRLNAIPMYAKRLNLAVPTVGKEAGFDFSVGDWMTPYGKGSQADIVFKSDFVKRAADDFDYTLVVTFPRPGDGIQEFRADDYPLGQGSELRSPHQAPEMGYQARWVQTQKKRPGQPVVTNKDERRNFFFRVRSVLDEKGQVLRAQYGKIYGDFMRFTYYLNPTANSRNVEFAPEKNLCQGLRPLEQVDAP